MNTEYINWDLVDENMTWTSPKEKIWNPDMIRVIGKQGMEEDCEYVIY